MEQTSIVPRLVKLDGAAAFFSLTAAEMSQQLPDLEARGFPQPVLALGLYDLKAIDIWVDRISGIRSDRFGFHPTEPLVKNMPDFAPKPSSAGEVQSTNPYTVAQAVDDYMVWYRTYRRRIKDTQSRVNCTILPSFGHLKVTDLTVQMIREWHSRIATSPRSVHVGFGKTRRYAPPPSTPEEIRKRRNTANHDLSILKAILNRALREGKVASDVGWRLAFQFPIGEVSRLECLSVLQCRRLLEFLPTDFGEFVRGTLLTGARYIEISSATVGDFDSAAGTIYFPPAKTCRSRHVVLTKEGVAFFRRMSANRERSEFIFRREDGEPWQHRDCIRYLQAGCRLAGLKPCTFHTLRHTYASAMIMMGVPLPALAKNLGHVNTRTVEKFYLHLTQSYVSKAILHKSLNLVASGRSKTNGKDRTKPDWQVRVERDRSGTGEGIRAWPRKRLLAYTKKMKVAGRHSIHRAILEQIVEAEMQAKRNHRHHVRRPPSTAKLTRPSKAPVGKASKARRIRTPGRRTRADLKRG